MTESSSARRGSTPTACDCKRKSEATVWRLFLTRWWISWARTPRITARPCSSATAAWCAIDERSCAVVVRERHVPVADELADLPPLPAKRHPDGVPRRPGPRARRSSVVEHDRRARGAQRLHGRLDDRLERLLDVERLRDCLGDRPERLELPHPPLGLRVQLRVLDREGDLRGDREQQVDLALREFVRLARAYVQRALELLAGEDRHGEDRLVLVLAEVRERLEAGVEVRLAGSMTGSRVSAA